MPRLSAGLLLFRRTKAGIEVLLVHPGGPLWRKRDEGAWSIPKGEVSGNEPLLDGALREFQEETGWPAPRGPFLALSPVRQAGGKIVHAWAVEGDGEVDRIRSGTFEMEWPPRSGVRSSFPEVDRAAWFSPDLAKRRINPAQAPIIEELLRLQATGGGVPDGGDGLDHA